MEIIIGVVISSVSHSHDTSDEELISEARDLFNKINKITAVHLINRMHDEFSNETNRLEKCISASVGPKAKFYIYKVCDLYCIIYKKPEDRIPYLQNMIDILEKEITDITEREKALTYFKMADVLYDENKIEEAHEYIYKIYTVSPARFKNLLSGFHLLLETSMLLEKYTLVETILENEFHDIILHQEEPYCTFAHLNYAKLYLLKGDYYKAIAQIIEIKRVSDQTPNTLKEAQMRIYETIYFFLTGDVEFAAQLVIVNMSFFDEHTINDRNHDLVEVLKIIDDIIDSSLQKTSLAPKTVDLIQSFQTGPKFIFGKLLARMAAQINLH